MDFRGLKIVFRFPCRIIIVVGGSSWDHAHRKYGCKMDFKGNGSRMDFRGPATNNVSRLFVAGARGEEINCLLLRSSCVDAALRWQKYSHHFRGAGFRQECRSFSFLVRFFSRYNSQLLQFPFPSPRNLLSQLQNFFIPAP